MSAVRQEFRLGLRLLLKNPGITLACVLALALGVGANTAIFSVVNGWLLRPLPVPHPDEIVVLASQESPNSALGGFSYLELRDLQTEPTVFAKLAAHQFGIVGLTGAGATDRFFASYVTSDFFPMLGIKPALGRLISGTEADSPGTAPALVLGYSYWKQHFNADLHIVGKSLLIDGHPVTVVGVAAEGFNGVQAFLEIQGYLPFGMLALKSEGHNLWTQRNQRVLNVIGRLNQGVTVATARASLDVISRRFQEQHPSEEKNIKFHLYSERLARPEPNAATSTPLIAGVFLILAGLLLALACFNVVGVLLVRATARQQETCIRAALGATAMRLVRQVLIETMLLAALGAIAGTVAGIWVSHIIASIPLQLDIPVRLDFSFDWRVFSFALAIMLIGGLVASFGSAIPALRVNLANVLQENTPAASQTRSRRRIRDAIVIAQLTASLTLLIIAGLFISTLQKAEHMDLGFDSSNIVNVTTDPRQIGLDEERGKNLHRELLERVRALHGVQSASLAFSVPFGYRHESSKLQIESPGMPATGQLPDVFYNSVTPDYFTTLRIPLVEGRSFSEADNDAAPRVAIVNESMAHRFWPKQHAIDKTFQLESAANPPIRVIGVVKDCKYRTPGDVGIPYFYLPLAQHYRSVLTLQVRTAEATRQMLAQIQHEASALQPGLPLFDLGTMSQVLEGGNGLLPLRLAAWAATGLGLLGMMLAVVGVYGVVSYSVTQRMREIAIRIALGAQRRTVLKAILFYGCQLVVIGIIAGILITLSIAHVIGGLLMGTSPFSVTVYSIAVSLLAIVALLAAFAPAQRAFRIDVTTMLRHQ